MPEREKKKLFIHYLPIYGCVSTCIIYLGIGVVAILSFLKLKHGGADEGSLLAFLNNYILGKIFIWIILLGTVSYIAWRIYEAIQDPYDYGKEVKGIAKRIGIALSTVADAFIAFSAIQVLLGSGNIQEDGDPEEQRKIVSHLLDENWGGMFIISIGAIIFITAVIQFLYGVTKGYKERLNITGFKPAIKNLIFSLALVGYFARGIILGIIGFFFIKAGIFENARYIVNTDKAFDFIGDDLGHVYFILVAIGTACYGLFMLALGVTYDSDKD